MTRLLKTVLAFFLLAGGHAATAADGVFEINAACVPVGCFAGDDPGWPVRIINSGSYVLTSNLVLGTGDGTAIITRTAGGTYPDGLDVTIDLNGFTIDGPTECTGDPLTCTPLGTPADTESGYGVLINSAGFDSTARIRNGTIRGMPLAAISCQPECLVEGVTAVENGFGGFSIDGTIRDSQAAYNGGGGISVSNAGSVENCVARANSGDGFFGSATYTGNTARGNAGFGIYANPGSVVRGNRVEFNGNGLRCIDCVAVDNVIANNTTAGINFFSNAGAWGRNMLRDNGANVVNAASAVQVDTNVCGTSPCP